MIRARMLMPAIAAVAITGLPPFHAIAYAPTGPPLPYTHYATLHAVKAQTALGWAPCTPRFAPLPTDLRDKGVVADAADAITFGYCEVRWMTPTAEHPLPPADVPYVAWHEACHLSTLAATLRSPGAYEDPAHEHPIFQACIAQGPDRPPTL